MWEITALWQKKIPAVETWEFLDVEMESVGNHCIWPKKHNPRVWGFFDMDYFWTLKIDFHDFRKMWEITAYGQKTHNPCVWGFWYIDLFWPYAVISHTFHFNVQKFQCLHYRDFFFSHNEVISHTFNLLSYPN